MTNSLNLTSILIVMCLCLVGCSSGPNDTPELTPVSGKVTLDGQPLADAQIEFEFMGEVRGVSTATTDSSGNYTLKFGSGANDGAKPGKHLVRITTQKSGTDAEGNDFQTEEKLPEKYNWNSELVVDVTTEKATGYDFELTSK